MERTKAVGLILTVPIVSFVFLYLHEWVHALGYCIDGLTPCVGVNNSWPAPPYQDVKTFVSALFGPLSNFTIGALAILAHFRFDRFRGATYVLSMVNLVAHHAFVIVAVIELLATGETVYIDETMAAVMLPDTIVRDVDLLLLKSRLTRLFLFQQWPAVVVWASAAVPSLLALFLAIKGRPLGNRSAFMFGVIVIIVCVLYGCLIHTRLVNLIPVKCF